MNYRIAKIKPHKIDETGVVTFTDGRKTGLKANKTTCEMYGYTYENKTGTCRLNQEFQATLERQFNNESNKIMGTGNFIDNGVRDALVSGTSNTVESMAKSPLVTGKDNKVNESISNATVIGVNGRAQRQSEFVIGGGSNSLPYSDTALYSDRQMSIIELAGVTANNTPTKLTINGDGSNYINVRNNSIIGYEIYLTRFEQGGSSGTAGNYSYRNLKGAVRIDDTYGMTFTTGFTRNIAKLGVNGSFSMVDSSTSAVKSMTIEVTDRNNVTNMWSAVIYLHEFCSTTTTY